MKDLTIGNKNYKLCEDVTDFLEFRLPYLQEFILRAFENNDLPIYDVFFNEYKKLSNEGNRYDCDVLVSRLKDSVTKNEPLLNNFHYAFALICLEDNENQLNVDLEYLKEKINIMFKEGLKGGVCVKSVLDFMVASPFEFRNYEAIIAFMKQTFSTNE